MKTIHYFIFACALSVVTASYAQDACSTTIIVVLKNTKGGIYAGQKITLTTKVSGKKNTISSDANGEATFEIPCNTAVELSVSNYSKKKEFVTPSENGSGFERVLTYEPDMLEKEKAMALTDAEKAQMDKALATLPDTTFIKGNAMAAPVLKDNFVLMTFSCKDEEDKPLGGEMVKFTGKKRRKSFKGTTGTDGTLQLYLPKGDEYTINFLYSPEYLKTDIAYSKGTVKSQITVSYLGTKEILRRKKEEAERIAAEEKRLKEEKAIFDKRCKELGISAEKGHLLEAKGTLYDHPDKENNSGAEVVSNVLTRNKWSEKLIVCDLTGSMSPYTAELALWFKLNYKKEKNLQFVFFNDGDAKADNEKVIGNTGGIYYAKATTEEQLVQLMAKVASAGYGGDCPENNMEALIKGTALASPYKELVMIVDNDAPVKDISLLKDFNKPVHIILCGSYDGRVLEDYLYIAKITKGSIHTIEQDITTLAGMMEGEELTIGKTLYKIMGGKFVRISKV